MLRTPIATHIKQTVWRRAGSQCEFIATTGPRVGKRCLSHFRLEIDHILSVAADGTNALTNLQLLCASHHRDKTTKEFPTFRLPKAG